MAENESEVTFEETLLKMEKLSKEEIIEITNFLIEEGKIKKNSPQHQAIQKIIIKKAEEEKKNGSKSKKQEPKENNKKEGKKDNQNNNNKSYHAEKTFYMRIAAPIEKYLSELQIDLWNRAKVAIYLLQTIVLIPIISLSYFKVINVELLFSMAFAGMIILFTAMAIIAKSFFNVERPWLIWAYSMFTVVIGLLVLTNNVNTIMPSDSRVASFSLNNIGFKVASLKTDYSVFVSRTSFDFSDLKDPDRGQSTINCLLGYVSIVDSFSNRTILVNNPAFSVTTITGFNFKEKSVIIKNGKEPTTSLTINSLFCYVNYIGKGEFNPIVLK